jgi:hypothetical protein
MSYENSAGLGVNNQYGVRDTQDSAVISGGVIEGGGAARDYVLYFDGDELGSADYDTGLTIPAGSVIVGAVLEITDAITMGNADNDIEFGTDGSVATNGVEFNNTTGAAGTYAVSTYNGTWAQDAVLANDTAVSVLVSGTTAGGTGGKGKLVVTVRKV